MTASPPRRALRRLLGAGHSYQTEPPALDGYSVGRRAFAGLLGVRLVIPPPKEQAGRPISFEASLPSDEDRHKPAASAIAAVDPVVRLIVRQRPLVVAVPMADLLVRAFDIAEKLTYVAGRVNDSTLARMRTFSHALSSDLDLVLDLARDRDLDLDLDSARTNAFALPSVLVKDLDPDFAPARLLILTIARNFVQVLTGDLALTSALTGDDLDLALGIASELDRALVLTLGHTNALADVLIDLLARAQNFASTLAEELRASLGIDHVNGLADALLAGAMEDFSWADLSEVDLAQIGLIGVRWSVSGTRWPADVDVDALMQQSEEIAPGLGIYVITRRRQTEWVGEEVRV